MCTQLGIGTRLRALVITVTNLSLPQFTANLLFDQPTPSYGRGLRLVRGVRHSRGSIRINIFWNVTLCTLIKWVNSASIYSILKIQVYFSETSVLNENTRRHILQD
jgi:hypothetical protein